MEKRSAYHTRQKALLSAYMRAQKDAPVTVEQILAYIRSEGLRVGQTTIYRHLDRLVREGVLIKYIGLGGTSASYQYVGDPKTHAAHSHLVCLQCGVMAHVDCPVVDEVAEHMQSDHAFRVDRTKTVFYGYCRDCGTRTGEAYE